MCAATLEGPRTPGRPPTGHGERGRVHGPWNAKWGSCTKKERDEATLTSVRKAECTTKRLDWNEKQRTDAWTLMLVGKQAASVGNGAPIAKKRGSRAAPPGKERRVLWSRARTRLFTSRVPATTYCCNETTIREKVSPFAYARKATNRGTRCCPVDISTTTINTFKLIRKTSDMSLAQPFS